MTKKEMLYDFLDGLKIRWRFDRMNPIFKDIERYPIYCWLAVAFPWNKTSEGVKYWLEVSDQWRMYLEVNKP